MSMHVDAEMMVGEIERISMPAPASVVTDNANSAPPPQKKISLFDQYEAAAPSADSHASPTALSEFRRYLELCDTGCGTPLPCLEFWAQQSVVLPRLHEVALNALAVPATGAPAECVFCSGRMFMRPHRARLSNKMLSNLVFLKCNMNKL